GGEDKDAGARTHETAGGGEDAAGGRAVHRESSSFGFGRDFCTAGAAKNSSQPPAITELSGEPVWRDRHGGCERCTGGLVAGSPTSPVHCPDALTPVRFRSWSEAM